MFFKDLYLSDFLAVLGLCCGGWALPCGNFSLWSTASRHAGSVVVAHRLSCSSACGIFLDQGSNPGPLYCKADP